MAPAAAGRWVLWMRMLGFATLRDCSDCQRSLSQSVKLRRVRTAGKIAGGDLFSMNERTTTLSGYEPDLFVFQHTPVDSHLSRNLAIGTKFPLSWIESHGTIFLEVALTCNQQSYRMLHNVEPTPNPSRSGQSNKNIEYSMHESVCSSFFSHSSIVIWYFCCPA